MTAAHFRFVYYVGIQLLDKESLDKNIIVLGWEIDVWNYYKRPEQT